MSGLRLRVYGLWIGIFLIVSILLFATSCQRDHLYYESSGRVYVTLDIDWSDTNMEPNGATVFAYNQDGTLYRRFDPFSDPRRGTIILPKGTYTLVVVNDTPEELSETMTFTDKENKSTFLIQGVRDDIKTQRLSASRSTDEYCILPPDELAVGRIENFVVDEKMVTYFQSLPDNEAVGYYPEEVKVKPQKVTSKAKIKAHVRGLSYSKGTTMSFIRGTSNGYYPALGCYSEQPVSYGFILNNRTFDQGSSTDGTITAEFNCWGISEAASAKGQRYILDINFVLIDGTSHPLSIDVTDKLELNVDLQLNITFNLDLDIELPPTDPMEGGGFHTELNAWSDIIQNIEM